MEAKVKRPSMSYPRKFGEATKKHIRKTAVRYTTYRNYLISKFGTTKIPWETRLKAAKEYWALTQEEREKYHIINEKGELQKEFLEQVKDAEEKTLAY